MKHTAAWLALLSMCVSLVCVGVPQNSLRAQSGTQTPGPGDEPAAVPAPDQVSPYSTPSPPAHASAPSEETKASPYAAPLTNRAATPAEQDKASPYAVTVPPMRSTPGPETEKAPPATATAPKLTDPPAEQDRAPHGALTALPIRATQAPEQARLSPYAVSGPPIHWSEAPRQVKTEPNALPVSPFVRGGPPTRAPMAAPRREEPMMLPLRAPAQEEAAPAGGEAAHPQGQAYAQEEGTAPTRGVQLSGLVPVEYQPENEAPAPIPSEPPPDELKGMTVPVAHPAHVGAAYPWAKYCDSCTCVRKLQRDVPVSDAPKEGRMRLAPPYIIENPDILLVESPRALPDQPISGEHLVRMDGTISLGLYGAVRVAGLTIDEARAAIEKHLAQFIKEPKVNVDVYAYNSKFFFIIADGAGYGQQVVRLNYTGNDTLLSAISQISGLPAVASKKRIWIARPDPSNEQCGIILPVNWTAITQCGQTATNYQLFPSDRIYIQSDRLIAFDALIAKIVSPLERVFGVNILGAAMVFRYQNMGRGAGGGGGGGF